MQETFENSLFNVRRMSIDRGYRGMSYLKVFCEVRGRAGVKVRLCIPSSFVPHHEGEGEGEGDPYHNDCARVLCVA